MKYKQKRDFKKDKPKRDPIRHPRTVRANAKAIKTTKTGGLMMTTKRTEEKQVHQVQKFQTRAFMQLQNLFSTITGNKSKEGVGELFIYFERPYEKDTKLNLEIPIPYGYSEKESTSDTLVLTPLDTRPPNQKITLLITDIQEEITYYFDNETKQTIDSRPLTDTNALIVALLTETISNPYIEVKRKMDSNLIIYLTGKKRSAQAYKNMASAICSSKHHFKPSKVGYKRLGLPVYSGETDFSLNGSILSATYQNPHISSKIESFNLHLGGTLKLIVEYDNEDVATFTYHSQDGVNERFANKLNLLPLEHGIEKVTFKTKGAELIFKMV